MRLSEEFVGNKINCVALVSQSSASIPAAVLQFTLIHLRASKRC